MDAMDWMVIIDMMDIVGVFGGGEEVVNHPGVFF